MLQMGHFSPLVYMVVFPMLLSAGIATASTTGVFCSWSPQQKQPAAAPLSVPACILRHAIIWLRVS